MQTDWFNGNRLTIPLLSDCSSGMRSPSPFGFVHTPSMCAGWWQCISTAAPTRSPGSCCAAARCSKPWPLMSGCSSPNTATVCGCACPRWPPELPIQSWQEHLLAGLNGLLHLQVLLTCSRLGLPSQSKYFSLLVQSLSTIVTGTFDPKLAISLGLH